MNACILYIYAGYWSSPFRSSRPWNTWCRSNFWSSIRGFIKVIRFSRYFIHFHIRATSDSSFRGYTFFHGRRPTQKGRFAWLGSWYAWFCRCCVFACLLGLYLDGSNMAQINVGGSWSDDSGTDKENIIFKENFANRNYTPISTNIHNFTNHAVISVPSTEYFGWGVRVVFPDWL